MTWIEHFIYTLRHHVVCFAFSSATSPSSGPGTLRQDERNQSCATLETRRFCCDLHGSPVPLQQQNGCMATKAWPAGCEYTKNCIPIQVVKKLHVSSFDKNKIDVLLLQL